MPEAKESVFFYCERYPELILTVRAEDWREVDGRAIKERAHRICFEKKPFRLSSADKVQVRDRDGNTVLVDKAAYRGEFMTSNPEEIRHIRESAYYRNGYIMEGEIPAQDQRVAPGGHVKVWKDGAIKEAVIESSAPPDVPVDPAKGTVAVKKRGRPAKQPVSA